jgi:ubiquitin-hydrolase Zn-finger-containing protein
MTGACTHLDTITGAPPSDPGCTDCLRISGSWVHLRRCAGCGHVGCCDSSPRRHASAHHRQTEHPLVQSFEPGEDWYWCYVDQLAFELAGDAGSPSHP